MFLIIKLILICIVYPRLCLKGLYWALFLFIIYINNLCNASKLFRMIIYADDTTLYSTLDVFGNYISKNLNLELTKVADWLKLNKLSINIKKSKFMVFHMPQKQVNILNIEVENIKIEFADEFNFFRVNNTQVFNMGFTHKQNSFQNFKYYRNYVTA